MQAYLQRACRCVSRVLALAPGAWLDSHVRGFILLLASFPRYGHIPGFFLLFLRLRTIWELVASHKTALAGSIQDAAAYTRTSLTLW